MEYLSLNIKKFVKEKRWKPLSLTKGGPKLSHTLFANDIMLFGEADTHTIAEMGRIRDDFCNWPGQIISFNIQILSFTCIGFLSAQIISDTLNIPFTSLGI